MKKIIFLLIFVLLIGSSFLVYSTKDNPSKVSTAVTNSLKNKEEVNVIVILKDESKLRSRTLSTFNDSEFKVNKRFRNAMSGYVTKEGLEKLSNSPNVEIVGENERAHAFLDESTTLTNVTSVHNFSHDLNFLNGTGETVCVVDTGIDTNHPNIQDKLVGEYCYCDGDELYTVAGCCANNEWEDTSAEDDEGHGTHVAGIISSQHSTYMGTSPGANIVAIKALDSTGSGWVTDIVSGIDWCTQNASRYNISVISLSLGGGAYNSYCDDDTAATRLYRDYIDAAVTRNLTVVVATGNDGTTNSIASPACIYNSTRVGAVYDDDLGLMHWSACNDTTTSAGKITCFTNRAAYFADMLLAPGSVITSLSHAGGTTDSSGTSQATPHVSAAVAILKQFYRLQTGMTMTNAQIWSTLNSTGTTIPDSSTSMGFAGLDILSAIRSIDQTGPNISFTLPTPESNTVTTNVSILINVSVNDSVLNISTCWLEWNQTTNFSMDKVINGSKATCYINKSLSTGNISYKVYANDTNNNWGVSPVRYIVNNSELSIQSFYPSDLNIGLVEPQNLTFNISYIDSDNDASIYWYNNGTIVSTADNYTFLGNYTSSGDYNITVIISDDYNSTSKTWNLSVNNTNIQATVSNVIISSTDPENRSNATLSATWTFSDSDNGVAEQNETKWYNNSGIVSTLTNLTSIISSNISKNQDWFISVRAYDGYNWSTWSNSSNITINNAAPVISLTQNTTVVNETQTVNITVNSTDIDNDAITYAINDTRFTSNSNNFYWQTNLTNEGTYRLSINATDGTDITYLNLTVIVSNSIDTDNDGNPDFNDTDDDGDGINDSTDTLKGNLTNINSSGIDNLSVTINGSSTLNQTFNSTLKVNISDGNITVIGFNWNFSNSTLDMSNITINKTNISGYAAISIKGLNLTDQNKTKTVYLNHLSGNRICILDQDADLSSLTSSCTGSSEVSLSCPGTNGGYTCTVSGTIYSISGLSHTVLKEYTYTAPSTPPGDGGGGSSPSTCTESWSCSPWSICLEDSTQTRSCFDTESCGTNENKPEIIRSCTYIAPRDYSNDLDEESLKLESQSLNEDIDKQQIEESSEQVVEEGPKPKPILGILPWIISSFAVIIVIFSIVIFVLAAKKRDSEIEIEADQLIIKGHKDEYIINNLKKTYPEHQVINVLKRINIRLEVLNQYIKKLASQGHKKSEIKNKLIEAGWPKHYIEHKLKHT